VPRVKDISFETAKEIQDRRLAGEGIDELLQEYGMSRATLSRVFRWYGLSTAQGCKCSEEEIDEIVASYLAGESSTAIAKNHGINHHTVLGYVKLRGHQVRTKEGWRVLNGDPSINTLLGSYRREAAKKGLPFEISREEFGALLRSDCYYCSLPPSNRQASHDDDFYYSGVDRIDSNKGYLRGNVVPCCFPCNTAKNNRTLEEFASWITRLIDGDYLARIEKLRSLVPEIPAQEKVVDTLTLDDGSVIRIG